MCINKSISDDKKKPWRNDEEKADFHIKLYNIDLFIDINENLIRYLPIWGNIGGIIGGKNGGMGPANGGGALLLAVVGGAGEEVDGEEVELVVAELDAEEDKVHTFFFLNLYGFREKAHFKNKNYQGNLGKTLSKILLNSMWKVPKIIWTFLKILL